MVNRSETVRTARRIVIKVGGSLLFRGGKPDSFFLEQLAHSIAELVRQGRKPILVLSGAIVLGEQETHIVPEFCRYGAIPCRQAFCRHRTNKAYGSLWPLS